MRACKDQSAGGMNGWRGENRFHNRGEADKREQGNWRTGEWKEWENQKMDRLKKRKMKNERRGEEVKR